MDDFARSDLKHRRGVYCPPMPLAAFEVAELPRRRGSMPLAKIAAAMAFALAGGFCLIVAMGAMWS